MSRHTQNNGNLHIAYGFDPIPGGGYFFQVFDDNAVTEENGEGIIVNEGFVSGMSRASMLEHMQRYGIKNENHIEKVALDLPF